MKRTVFSRITTLVLVCFMVVSVCGCGQKATTSTYWEESEEVVGGTKDQVIKGQGAATQIVTQDGKVVEVETRDKVSSGGGVDLGGASVSIACWGTALQEPQPGNADYKDKVALVASIEKKYNCKLKWVHIADSLTYNSTWAAAAAAGAKFADIMTIDTSWAMPTQIMKGYITPIDDYYNFNDPVLNGKAMNTVSYKGKHYILYTAGRAGIPTGTYFNKDLFSRFGVKSPADYVKENNWNWNTFLECAKNMTRVSGGTQYYGYALKNGNIGVWATTNTIFDPNQDVTKFQMDKPAYIEGIQFAWDLYNTHNVTPRDCDNSVNAFKNGTVAMMYGDAYESTELKEAIGSSNLGFTHLPLGKRVSSYSQLYSSSTGVGWIIPSTVKNPEVMAKILYDWVYPYTWRISWEETNQSLFGDKQSYETAKEMSDYASKNIAKPSPLALTNIGWGNYGIQQKIAPQAYIDSVKAEAQASLDSIWAGYTP